MKQLKCGDVVPGCEWVTRTKTRTSDRSRSRSHAREAHGMDEVPPEIVDRIRA